MRITVDKLLTLHLSKELLRGKFVDAYQPLTALTFYLLSGQGYNMFFISQLLFHFSLMVFYTIGAIKIVCSNENYGHV